MTARASISSRNSVPRRRLKQAGLARLASEGPASKPNNSAQQTSGIAAQLTSMNGPRARGPLSWMIRATSPCRFPAEQERRDIGIAERIESRQMADLRAEIMDRGGLSNQAGGGMARWRRTWAAHGTPPGVAAGRDDIWRPVAATRAKVAATL